MDLWIEIAGSDFNVVWYHVMCFDPFCDVLLLTSNQSGCNLSIIVLGISSL